MSLYLKRRSKQTSSNSEKRKNHQQLLHFSAYDAACLQSSTFIYLFSFVSYDLLNILNFSTLYDAYGQYTGREIQAVKYVAFYLM